MHSPERGLVFKRIRILANSQSRNPLQEELGWGFLLLMDLKLSCSRSPAQTTMKDLTRTTGIK